MQRHPNLLLTWLSGAVLLTAACDGNNGATEVSCPSDRGPFELGAGRVTGTLEFDTPEKPLSRGDTLIVHGTAHHEDGLAIREVRVAGVAATRDEFNFKSFTVEVPYANIASAGPLTAQGQVTFEAVAIDACGNRYPFAEATVDVDPTPTVAVDELAIEVSYPPERDFLPADGTAPAILKITGQGRALGAVVRVQASSGRLESVDEQGDVTLAAPAGTTDQASATVLLYGTDAGTVTVTALVENQLASALVTVAGPPALSPEAATLVPGEALEVGIEGAGETITCRASAVEDLGVSDANGDPLDSEPRAIEAIDGARAVSVVASDTPAGSGGTIVVTCEDAYGQSGTGRYTLSLGTFDGGDSGGDPGADGGFDGGFDGGAGF